MPGRLGPQLSKTFLLVSLIGRVGGCPTVPCVTGQCREHMLMVPVLCCPIPSEIAKSLQEKVRDQVAFKLRELTQERLQCFFGAPGTAGEDGSIG